MRKPKSNLHYQSVLPFLLDENSPVLQRVSAEIQALEFSIKKEFAHKESLSKKLDRVLKNIKTNSSKDNIDVNDIKRQIEACAEIISEQNQLLASKTALHKILIGPDALGNLEHIISSFKQQITKDEAKIKSLRAEQEVWDPKDSEERSYLQSNRIEIYNLERSIKNYDLQLSHAIDARKMLIAQEKSHDSK